MNLLMPRSEPYKARKPWLTDLKSCIKLQLRRFPPLYSLVIGAWRSARWITSSLRWKIVILFDASIKEVAKAGVDIDRTHWVSPQQIMYCSLQEFSLNEFKGRVIEGDWDCLGKRFEDLDLFVALDQVLVGGKDWQQTVFYKRFLDRVNRGESLWGCRDEIDVRRRCDYIRSLYETIKQDGYKSLAELSKTEENHDPNLDEIGVCIGRHGDILFSDGAHRLAIAKLLGLERIPVKISIRHPEWVRFRKELLLFAKEQGGRLYQPIIHPSLSDIPFSQDCEGRFAMIKGKITAKRGRLLDIGANLGYFCHRFEDEGFDCYALENSRKELYFLSKLRRAENKEFKIISQSALEFNGIKKMEFDVVLALNIFHHFLKARQDYDMFVNLLGDLRTQELFFEPHLPNEPQMLGAYKNYRPEEFVDFILRMSNLRNAEFIGEVEDGRKIYRLY